MSYLLCQLVQNKKKSNKKNATTHQLMLHPLTRWKINDANKKNEYLKNYITERRQYPRTTPPLQLPNLWSNEPQNFNIFPQNHDPIHTNVSAQPSSPWNICPRHQLWNHVTKYVSYRCYKNKQWFWGEPPCSRYKPFNPAILQ